MVDLAYRKTLILIHCKKRNLKLTLFNVLQF